jgi:hypothetical protein
LGVAGFESLGSLFELFGKLRIACLLRLGELSEALGKFCLFFFAQVRDLFRERRQLFGGTVTLAQRILGQRLLEPRHGSILAGSVRGRGRL